MEIRVARVADLEQAVALSNVVRPYAFGVRHRLERNLIERLGTDRHAAFAAEVDGQVVGWATLSPADWLGMAHAFSLDLMVHPEYRRRGVGTRLLQACDEWLERLPSSFVQSYADRAGTPFAVAAGFTAAEQLTYAGLELDDSLIAPPVPAGFTLVPISQLEAVDVYPAYRATAADTPGMAGVDWPYEWFSNDLWKGELLDRDLSLALVRDGVVASFTLTDREGDRIWSDMTGTLAEYRGRGLAATVKLTSLAAARKSGATHAYTIMNLTNAPMLAINTRLGYRTVDLRTYVTRSRP
ncbi:GNAT family N-acetyltransferase [Kribbella sp. NPDC026611]|uniref:GNAT family N-acetyltransferase n=1 Tax=Kribbella sp. NPDC026611 TaxID=3154911 RepID=UPI0033ED0BC7